MADCRRRKQSQPPKDDYQRLLIENLIAANQEATRNFQTLLRTIGPSDETGSIMTTSTRKLSIGESTLVAEVAPSDEVQAWSMVTEEANPKRRAPPETNLAERPRGMPSLDEDSGSSQFAISGTSSATETTMACLKRIQQALDQFEASEENLKSARQIAVSIEVYKHILQSDIDARMRKPWEVVSIARREDGNAFRQGRSDALLHQNQVVLRNSSERSGLQRIPKCGQALKTGQKTMIHMAPSFNLGVHQIRLLVRPVATKERQRYRLRLMTPSALCEITLTESPKEAKGSTVCKTRPTI
jgi:hypothetical protein